MSLLRWLKRLFFPETQPRGHSKARADLPFAEVGQVRIDRQGTIFFNGQGCSLEQLKLHLHHLSAANGAVLYSREDPGVEPSPEVASVIDEVIHAITTQQLPVSLVEPDLK